MAEKPKVPPDNEHQRAVSALPELLKMLETIHGVMCTGALSIRFRSVAKPDDMTLRQLVLAAEAKVKGKQ